MLENNSKSTLSLKQPIRYNYFLIVNTMEEMPVKMREIQELFAANQLNFYYAVQHSTDKNYFFVIKPGFKDEDKFRYVIFDAIQENRLFQAVIFNTLSTMRFSFVTNFKIMHTFERVLFHGGKKAF